MEKEALNRYLNKLNESIRNMNKFIESVNNDIEKNKKQHNIEKRIDRLVASYKEIYGKYAEISELKNEEIEKIQENLIDIKEKVEATCKKGSKDLKKQNINLEKTKTVITKDTNKVYDDEQEVMVIRNKIGEPEFFCIPPKEYKKRDKKIERQVKKKERKEKRKKFVENFFEKLKKGKGLKRIAALGMGALMLMPSTITANQNENTKKDIKDSKQSYSNSMGDLPINNNNFVKLLRDLEETKAPKGENNKLENINMQENTTKEQEEVQGTIESAKEQEIVNKDEVIHIIAPANSRYTEVSDGSGNAGYFTEDTEVAIYNRALIRTNSDGTKSVLKATKIGQSWEEYAKEKGIDYIEFKEYIENNENIEEIISTMSVDGKLIYGWMPSSNFQYRGENQQVNVKRSYTTEIEER